VFLSILVLSLLGDPTSAPTPALQPGLEPSMLQPLRLGPPRLLSKEILDGGFNNIDAGVFVEFGPQGRRYEVWEVQKNVSMNHALVLAYDAAGAELWRTKFTWQQDPWFKPLGSTIDAAGDLYFMYLANAYDLYRWRIVKVTAAGVVAWDKTLHSTTWGPEPTFLAPHPQGGVVVHSAAQGKVRDLYTARIAADGALLWQHKFDAGGKNQYPGGLAVAADGSVYVAGDDSDTHVLKYAADGALLWQQDYPGALNEHLRTRHVFLASDGNLVVAGSTYAGGAEPDWYFVAKYSPGGARLRSFVAKLGNDVKLADHGLKNIHATHAPDDTVYFAWDHDHTLASKWTVTRVDVPPEPQLRVTTTKPAMQPAVHVSATIRVAWQKTFHGERAMSVEKLLWFPHGALGVFGRGHHTIQANTYRHDTRLVALEPNGDDLGRTDYTSPGNFNNEAHAFAVDPRGVAHVLGWQYWSGDGWNDENVMRLRFTLGPP